jgi:membrane-bound lytic murein transglycosylase D
MKRSKKMRLIYNKILNLGLSLLLCSSCLNSKAEEVSDSENVSAEIGLEKSEPSEGVFDTKDDEETPVQLEEIAGEKSLTPSRPWRAPEFNKQEGALGWTETAFDIPAGLEPQVKFWIDIYSKYNSDQGVLHDAENIEFIYSEVDFSSITQRVDINEFQKERMRTKVVKDEKKRIIAVLKKLEKVKDPSSLEGDEKKYWDFYSGINEKKKFINATKKNRLRFQLGQKDRMIQGIYFSGRYLEEFERIFREAGVPIELTRLVFVESSFNVLARSKVGASGLWQIMPYTAKPYKMINKGIDKRNHPIEATRVAAQLLKSNYGMLESWPLAVTGWNHGPTGIRKLSKKYKTRELGELVQIPNIKRRFGFASRNFYASFMAALEVERNATKYLGKVAWSQPLDSVEITTPVTLKFKDLLNWFDGDELKAQIFNPHITGLARRGKVPLSKGAVLTIPKAKFEQVMADINDPARQEPPPKVSKRNRLTKKHKGNKSARSSDGQGR